MTALSSALLLGPCVSTASASQATETTAFGVVSTSVAAANTNPIQLYVTSVYQNLFHRAPDPSGLQTWTSSLASGVPRIAVANAITYSAEFRTGLIADSYRQFLSRSPEPAGLQDWLVAMGNGLKVQDMQAGFIASNEYFARAGGTYRGWVTALYHDVLGRTATAPEIDGWENLLNSGLDRAQVAAGFLYSSEHLSTVINGEYEGLLGRGIDPSGRWTWVSAIQQGARIEAVIGGIIASPEYYNRSAGAVATSGGTTPGGTTPGGTTPGGTTPGGVKPGQANTGVPAGTALTPYYGDLVITTPGTVIDGLDVHGFVKVKASNVTIQNSIVRGGVATSGQGMVTVDSGAANVLIQDSELVAENPSPYTDGLRGSGFTARRLNVHGVIDTAHLYGNDVTIESSWFHDNLHYLVDPNHAGGPSHDDSIQIQIGSNISIVGNTLESANNAALMITQDQGAVGGVTFDKNWAGGGACTLNIAEKGKGVIQGLAIEGNTFVKNASGCGMMIPTTTMAVTSYSANVYTTGNAITVIPAP